MNEYDTERMLNVLAEQNYSKTEDPEEADLIVINTCSVREKSEQKFFSLLGRLQKLRKKHRVLLAVGGCVAQQEGEKILDRAPYVDLVFGTSAIDRLPGMIDRVIARGKAQVDIDLTGEETEPGYHPLAARSSSYTAFVTVMRGCNNFCSYCVVPYVRGRERSRPQETVVREVQALAERGVKEVTLLGQNVNSYGCTGEESNGLFPQLLRAIDRVEGIQRIRFTTSHPKDLSESLIACFGEVEKLCPHIHLPLQSGSNGVLARMNRCYTIEEYQAKVERLRVLCPDIALTTDLIVGFPGETEEDFQQTLDAVRRIEYDEFFSFKYSDRPNTRASEMDQKVEEEEKSRRLTVLQNMQKAITLRRNRALVGKVSEILVEGGSKRNCVQQMGRTGTNKIVNFEGPSHLHGEMVMVEIVSAHPHSLQGRLV